LPLERQTKGARGGAYSYALHAGGGRCTHALVDRPLATRPREDGALFPRTDHLWPIVVSYHAKGGSKMSSLHIDITSRRFVAQFLCPSIATISSWLFYASLNLPCTCLGAGVG
ncbi:unnamed protein product, partial [Ectocarpus sp. 12 AP-2014]